MRFSGVKCDDYAFTFGIHSYIAHARNFHERCSQFANAFVAIFAFGCDGNSFQNGFVGVLKIVRVSRVEMMWVERLDHR